PLPSRSSPTPFSPLSLHDALPISVHRRIGRHVSQSSASLHSHSGRRALDVLSSARTPTTFTTSSPASIRVRKYLRIGTTFSSHVHHRRCLLGNVPLCRISSTICLSARSHVIGPIFSASGPRMYS